MTGGLPYLNITKWKPHIFSRWITSSSITYTDNCEFPVWSSRIFCLWGGARGARKAKPARPIIMLEKPNDLRRITTRSQFEHCGSEERFGFPTRYSKQSHRSCPFFTGLSCYMCCSSTLSTWSNDGSDELPAANFLSFFFYLIYETNREFV